MRELVLLLALAGCGSSDVVIIVPDESVLEDLAGLDLTGADLTRPSDLAWTDLAGGVDIAEPPPDLRQAPDLACSAVPQCSGGPSSCCNGAMSCINGNCQNMPGQPCNLDGSKGPIVTCWNGSAMGGPSGVCGAGGTCLP